MKSYSQYHTDVSYAQLEESISGDIKKLIKKHIKDPTEKALLNIKDKVVKQMSPKIKAWGESNRRLLETDKKFGGLIKQAIEEPQKLADRLFRSVVNNNEIKI